MKDGYQSCKKLNAKHGNKQRGHDLSGVEALEACGKTSPQRPNDPG